MNDVDRDWLTRDLIFNIEQAVVRWLDDHLQTFSQQELMSIVQQAAKQYAKADTQPQ